MPLYAIMLPIKHETLHIYVVGIWYNLHLWRVCCFSIANKLEKNNQQKPCDNTVI